MCLLGKRHRPMSCVFKKARTQLRGMCMSGKRRRQITCNIAKHACTDVAGVHLESNINQRHATSTKAFKNQLCRVHIDNAIWIVFWVYPLWHMNIVQVTSAMEEDNNKGLNASIVGYVHRLMNIKSNLNTVVMLHLPMEGSIN